MAESTGFQHITVVPADEEIVIRAGARVAEDEPVIPTQELPAQEAEPIPDAVAFEAAEPETSVEDARAEAQLAHLESSSGNFSRALHEAIAEERAGKPGREVYRETTLEDLEGTPMSGLQKIILFALAGILVLFGVYCALHFGAHIL